MRIRYRIEHHPGLYTSLMIEPEGQKPYEIEHRLSWAMAREYARESLLFRGVEPVIENPAPYVELFPWVEVPA